MRQQLRRACCFLRVNRGQQFRRSGGLFARRVRVGGTHPEQKASSLSAGLAQIDSIRYGLQVPLTNFRSVLWTIATASLPP